MKIGLGLDTGGTFTDAVVMDLDESRLLCKAKAPTTHEDLCIGIREAVGRMPEDLLSRVGIVSLSSTLATNSVVEGKGARVALVSIGGEYDGSCPADYAVRVSGSHDLGGRETVPLDEDAVIAFLKSIGGRVDGIAVAGYLAVRNPEHEVRVRNLISKILGIPAVCSHELSSELGFSERASTCIMNARLIPVIDDLIRSVKAVLGDMGISAPLMIVRGDGSMMGEAEARIRPVETVMSGPAASLIGAMRLTGRRDAIVMDMGGTTTDIGVVRNGRPRLEKEGATIGGIRTRVAAAEISTSGIGGDSRIGVLNGEVFLSPLRVIPLCRAVMAWPSLKRRLEGPGSIDFATASVQTVDTVVLDTEFFLTVKVPSDLSDYSDTDVALLHALEGEPLNLREAGEALGIHPFILNVRRLESRGLLQRIGFTPTDLMHACGTYREYDYAASVAAVERLSEAASMDAGDFMDRCRLLIRDKLCSELMAELLSEETGTRALGPGGEDLLSKAISGEPGRDYGCSIRVTKPIVGIGAPSGMYIPWVGEALGAEVLIHEDSDVGNAVGAISSSVSETVKVLIRPESIGSEDSFQEFSRFGRFEFGTLEEALRHAEGLATDKARESVMLSGADDIAVSCDIQTRRFRYGNGGEEAIIEVELTVIAAGRPKQFPSQRVSR